MPLLALRHANFMLTFMFFNNLAEGTAVAEVQYSCLSYHYWQFILNNMEAA